MAGISIEVVAAFGLSVVSGLEIEGAKERADEAKSQAVRAVERAASIENTNALLWQSNIVLRTQLEALEAKVRFRTITAEQMTNFVFLSEKVTKIPITISLRACLKMHLEFSETSQHEANHRQVNDGFAGQGLAFVVPSESAGTPEPTECSLHYPAPWQHLEGMQVATLHDFDGATPQFACQPQQGAGIATVGPDMFDSAASLLTEEGRQQLLGAIAILDIGGQYSDQEQQAKGVDQDMSLASINLFSGVVAPLVAAFGTLDALAVDDGRTGLGLASFDHTHLLPQMAVNRHPQTGALPEPEIVVSGAPGSKVLWQIAPLTASLDDIEDCVEQLAEGVLAWPALLVGLGETIVDELPFAVSQIRCISHRKRITDCGTSTS